MNIHIDEKLNSLGISLAWTHISFQNKKFNKNLWTNLLNPLVQNIQENDGLETIRQNQQIIDTKTIYRKLGKDPARFRPSSDSLWRRVVQRKGLYQINDLVDLNNYFSLKYKIPMGSYDLAHLTGNLILTTGGANETYKGIGKGEVNLENLLILRDMKGPFGSPTSDSERGMISEETQQALVIAYLFSFEEKSIQPIQDEIKQTMEKCLNSCVVKAQGFISS